MGRFGLFRKHLM